MLPSSCSSGRCEEGSTWYVSGTACSKIEVSAVKTGDKRRPKRLLMPICLRNARGHLLAKPTFLHLLRSNLYGKKVAKIIAYCQVSLYQGSVRITPQKELTGIERRAMFFSIHRRSCQGPQRFNIPPYNTLWGGAMELTRKSQEYQTQGPTNEL